MTTDHETATSPPPPAAERGDSTRLTHAAERPGTHRPARERPVAGEPAAHLGTGAYALDQSW
ncbi:hypothetical protein ACOJQ7_12255, partial [Streptomyces bohaiensis]